MNKTLVFKGANAMVTPNEVVEDAVIVIRDGRIAGVGQGGHRPRPRRGANGWTMARIFSPPA